MGRNRSVALYISPDRRRQRGRPRIRCGALALALLGSCAPLNIYTVEEDVQLGKQAYEQLLAEERLVASGSELAEVQRVTERLVAATRETDPEIASVFEWEVRLIDDDEVVNAYCLPGGKMAVYTGILPVAGGEEGLAVVMGHEIAHAILRHGTQAISRGALFQVTSAAVTAMLEGGATADQLSSVATGLAQLKFGRDAELEADAHGLRTMALAGYDPRQAMEFWGRMSELGQAPQLGALGEWLSTHPSDQKRLERLQELMPEAVRLWQGKSGSPPAPAPGKTSSR